LTFLFTDQGHICQPGIVKRQFDRLFDHPVCGIVKNGQAPRSRLRVDVQDAVDISPIRPAQVNDVGVEDLPVFLVEIDPLPEG